MVACALNHNLSKHLTLTLDPKKVVGDPWVYLTKTWNKMRVYLWRLSRRRKRRLKWLKNVQIQPGTGLPHFHITLSEYIPYKWIKKAWDSVGGGSVYIRYIKPYSIRGFIKGYFTSGLHDDRFPKHRRRYSASRKRNKKSILEDGKLPKAEGWKIMQWISKPNYSKGGYHTEVKRMDFLCMTKPIFAYKRLDT